MLLASAVITALTSIGTPKILLLLKAFFLSLAKTTSAAVGTGPTGGTSAGIAGICTFSMMKCEQQRENSVGILVRFKTNWQAS